jgi:hypothetical protein
MIPETSEIPKVKSLRLRQSDKAILEAYFIRWFRGEEVRFSEPIECVFFNYSRIYIDTRNYGTNIVRMDKDKLQIMLDPKTMSTAFNEQEEADKRYAVRVAQFLLKVIQSRIAEPGITIDNYYVVDRYPLVLNQLASLLRSANIGYDDRYVGFKNERRFGFKESTSQIFYYKGDNVTFMRVGKGIRKLMSLLGTKIDDNSLKRVTDIVRGDSDKYDLIEVVGEDITKYYNHASYDFDESNLGTLPDSCMRHDSCSEYFEIYEDNCRMAILKNKSNGKIAGRALIWENVLFQPYGDSEVCATLMDRIYSNETNRVMFQRYAKRKGYWTKERQTYDNKQEFVTPEGDNVVAKIRFELDKHPENYEYFPYADTLTYGCDNELTNYRNYDGDCFNLRMDSTGGYNNY